LRRTASTRWRSTKRQPRLFWEFLSRFGSADRFGIRPQVAGLSHEWWRSDDDGQAARPRTQAAPAFRPRCASPSSPNDLDQVASPTNRVRAAIFCALDRGVWRIGRHTRRAVVRPRSVTVRGGRNAVGRPNQREKRTIWALQFQATLASDLARQSRPSVIVGALVQARTRDSVGHGCVSSHQLHAGHSGEHNTTDVQHPVSLGTAGIKALVCL